MVVSGEAGAGWICSTFCGYVVAHAGLISAGMEGTDELEGCARRKRDVKKTHTHTEASMHAYRDICIARLDSRTFSQRHISPSLEK